MIIRICWMVMALVISAYVMQDAYGHGIGFERLPAQRLGGDFVALEVLSSQYTEPDVPDREIQFILFDNDTDITIRDAVFHIRGEKSGHVLFEENFATTDGKFVFVLLGGDTSRVEMVEQDKAGFLDRLVGLNKDVVEMRSSLFNTGGLYTFEVRVVSTGPHGTPESPVLWNVGLSIPDRTRHLVEDPYFGGQEISVITYYDEIYDFDYDPRDRSVSFTMPFEWDAGNIGETPVVHEEFAWSKKFGDLMSSEFVASVNGHVLPDNTVTIDDFAEDQRTVHIIINTKNLMDQYEMHQYKKDVMRFVLRPAPDAPLQTVTDNGEYRLTLESGGLVSGQESDLVFDIEDTFTRSQAEVSYDVVVTGKGGTIFQESGTSNGGEPDRLSFEIPRDSGVIYVAFENIGGADRANAVFGVVTDRDDGIFVISDSVRDMASDWSDGLIADGEFVDVFRSLAEAGAIRASDGRGTYEDPVIPGWIRDAAGWWSDGLMTDDEFADFVQYLVRNDIMTF